ncbi:MAG: DinB family protein [Acidobacteria bacterium]|nr:DinB family protein [Acidobacteriota bacterium]
MNKFHLTLTATFLLTFTSFAQAQSLTADAKAAWANISGNIVKAAEKMPAEEYAFRPATGVRSYGELIGHIADANIAFCAPLHPEKRTPSGAEKNLKDKAALVNALKDSVAYCSAAYDQLTDAQAAEMVKLFGRDKAKLSVAHQNIAHDNEHYGNLVTYLRIKGIVPPSSEPRQTSALPKIYYDQAHGQMDMIAPANEMLRRLNLEVTSSKQPLTTQALQGHRLVYLRAPSGTFTDDEKNALIGFVKSGGALFLVLDEENRQSLATTGVNDIITPFRLKLTPDTPYVHNCGGIAKSGEINSADREIPYSGGRAVEGGTPFAYQLDKDGKPAQAFAAYQKFDNGGRILVMGEGMASLFLGKPEGVRLTGKDRDPQGTVYWGKDSQVFMAEVFTWLIRK